MCLPSTEALSFSEALTAQEAAFSEALERVCTKLRSEPDLCTRCPIFLSSAFVSLLVVTG